MSELNKLGEIFSDGQLGEVVGGLSANYLAALDVMDGKYGNGEDRQRRLAAAGYDYWTVQRLVNGISKGYDAVAKDVIAGRYGYGQARVNALNASGYDAALVQELVNEMLL